MKYYGIFLGWFLLLCFPIFANETLESEFLRLEVTKNPYSFKIIEKKSRASVLKHNQTHFKKDATQGQVAQIIKTTKSPDSIKATLSLANSRDTIDVAFTFVTPKVLQISLSHSSAIPDDKQKRKNVFLQEEFADNKEHYYGLWESPYPRVDDQWRNKKIVHLDNREVEGYLIGSQYGIRGADWVSSRAPFYLTTNNYGIYVDSLWQGYYQFAKNGKTSFKFFDSSLKYYFIYGTYKEIFASYNKLSGPAFMPPDWALGSMWWRDDIHEDLRSSNGTLKNSQQVVLNDVAEMTRLRMPVSSICMDRPYLGPQGAGGWILDGWGTYVNGHFQFDKTFDDAAKMIKDLDKRGVKLVSWIANRTNADLQKEAKPLGYLFKDGHGAIDIRNKDAYNWFQNRLDDLVKLGIKGFKIDRGDEHNLFMGIAFSKEVPHYMTNYNATYFPKLAYDALKKRHQDSFVFARTVYDRGRKYSAVWNGDAFGWKGLRESLKHGLRAAAINFPMWGSDTGGYKETSPELFARWMQFSAFSPLMEVMIGPKRTPWYDFGKGPLQVVKQATIIKHHLIPYLKSFLYQSTKTGMPVMRQMNFEFPQEKQLFDTWDQYMFGSELLVAPVVKAKARERQVYLPQGKWLDYADRKVYIGGKTITVNAPLRKIPVFIRQGAIFPHGDIHKFNNNWTNNWKPQLTIEVFPCDQKNAEFQYFTGKKVQKITMTATPKLKIQFADLGTGGWVKIHCKKFGTITRNGSKLKEGEYEYNSYKQILSIPFTTATTIEINNCLAVF